MEYTTPATDPIAFIPPEERPETTVKEPKRRRVTNAGLAILDGNYSHQVYRSLSDPLV